MDDTAKFEMNTDEKVEAVKNDSQSFVLLYRENYGRIFKYCCHRLFDKDIAEDITAEVFLAALKKFDSFRGCRSDFTGWLYVIATNEINQWIRKHARHKIFLKKVGHIHLSAEQKNEEGNIRLAVLKQAVMKLKISEQTLISLRFFENLKYDEIAKILNKKESSVRSQLCRANAKLKKYIIAIEKRCENAG